MGAPLTKKKDVIVIDEPEISNRRTPLPAHHHTGDRFAGSRVVTIGGGSGTFSFLSHLKKYPFYVSAIVPMSDSGGRFSKMNGGLFRPFTLRGFASAFACI